MLLAKPNLKYSFDELEISTAKTPEDNIYHFLHELANMEAVIWVGAEAIYADELRADYKSGELYLPVYRYDTFTYNEETYTHNNRVEKIILHSYENGWENTSIVVQTSIFSNYAYRIDISTMKMVRDLEESDRDARDLFLRYLVSSYSYTSFESDYKKYNRVSIRNITRAHREALRQSGLNFYGGYLELDYRSVRDWKLEYLAKQFDSETLRIEEPRGARRVYFELELYTRLFTGQLWTGWTDGNLEELQSNNREYLKYKEKGIYLIFKGNWLREINH